MQIIPHGVNTQEVDDGKTDHAFIKKEQWEQFKAFHMSKVYTES